jgi:hypothetical protein
MRSGHALRSGVLHHLTVCLKRALECCPLDRRQVRPEHVADGGYIKVSSHSDVISRLAVDLMDRAIDIAFHPNRRGEP